MGVFGFFMDPDNRFGRAMGWIGLVVLTNLLFLLCSLPIISIGASYTAMYHVLLSSLRKKTPVNPFSEFGKGIRNNWKQATLLWCGGLIILFLLFMELYWSSQLNGIFELVVPGITAAICIIIVIMMFLFPSVSAFQGTIKEQLRNGFYFCMYKPVLSIGVIVCNIALPGIYVLDQVNQPTYAFLMFFGGFSFGALLSSHILLKKFNEYLPPLSK